MNIILTIFLLITLAVPTPTPQPTSRARQPMATPTPAPTVRYHDIYIDGGDGFMVALDGGWEISADGDGFLLLEHATGAVVSITPTPNEIGIRPSYAGARLLLKAFADNIGATCINNRVVRLSTEWYAAFAVCFDLGYVEDGVVEADMYDAGKGMFAAFVLHGNVAEEDSGDAVVAIRKLLESAEAIDDDA